MSYQSRVAKAQRVLAAHSTLALASWRLSKFLRGVLATRLSTGPEPSENGELLLLEHMARRPGGAYVDVGMNRGAWSDLVLSLDPAARIVGVEANPELLDFLTRKFAGTNVKVVSALVGDVDARRRFFIEPGGQTQSSVVESHTRGGTAISLDERRLDELPAVGDLGHLTLCKIDVEGMDAAAVRGLTGLLAPAKVDAVQFEYNEPWRNLGESLAAVEDLLRRYGYTLYCLRSDGLYLFDLARYGDVYMYANFVALSPAGISALEPLLKGEV